MNRPSTPTELAQGMIAILKDKGWTQGTRQDAQGRVCLLGAMALCLNADPMGRTNFLTGTSIESRLADAILDHHSVRSKSGICTSTTGQLMLFNDHAKTSRRTIIASLKRSIKALSS